MTDFPDLKLKTLVSFPASVTGGAGIDVVKRNGNYQFNLGFGDFAPPVAVLPPADVPNLNVLAWNKNTGAYWLTPIPLITNGIQDAPTDGTGPYGRQSAGWVLIPASGGSFIQAGAGAVTRTMQDKARERISVLDFGAKGDAVTDDTAAIAAAIAATPSGGTLHVPTGIYKIIGSGNAIFSYSKSISIVGDGYGSMFYVDASVPSTRDVFYINPSTPIQGGGLFNFEIAPSSGAPARYGIHIDTTANTTTSYQALTIDGVFCARLGASALYLHGRSDGNGVANAYFTNNSFQGGITITYAGDSLVIANNTIGGTTVGILATQIAGSGNLVIRENNIVANGHESIVIDAAIKPIIVGNVIEWAFNGSLAGSGMINLRGLTATILNPTIHDNQIQVALAGIGNPNPILVGAASDTQISLNRVNTFGAVAHIVNGASALRTNIVMNNAWSDANAVVDLKMTDSGSGTIAPETAWTPYTPVVTMTSGAATATGQSKKIGKTVALQVLLSVSAGGVIDHMTLPYPAAGGSFVLAGRDGSTNLSWQGIASGSSLYLTRYDASQTLATGASVTVSGTYQST